MAPPKKTKHNNRRGMSKKISKKKSKKRSIKKTRTVSKKRYTDLLKKKTMRKKMDKKDKKELEKELDKALFVNYCKCIKKLKYSKDYQEGAEYPICMTSVYKNRGLKPPKDVAKKCKR